MTLLDSEKINIKPWCVRLQIAAQVSPQLRDLMDERNRIDLGDPTSLSLYNQAVVKVMANLDITVPENNLIPTICLRQAYLVVLMESLLVPGDRVIEIGTGASSVISLLAAKLYNLSVDATEVDEVSYNSAKHNIEENNLGFSIRLIKSSGEILKGLISEKERYDALLCYPPTYPEDDNTFYSKEISKSGFRGTVSEMIGGGSDGFDFIAKLIEEAIDFNITHITLLLIFEDHVSRVIKLFQDHNLSIKQLILQAGMRERYLVVGSRY